LTPLIVAPESDIAGYIDAYIQRFARDVAERIRKHE
jgi:hypothetical protein